MAPGATLVLSILMIISISCNAAKYALNEDKYIKQYRRREIYENSVSSSVLTPLICKPFHTDLKIVDVICSQCRTVRTTKLHYQYERTMGRFIVSYYLCNKCDTNKHTFVPVDPHMCYPSAKDLYNRWRRGKKLEAKPKESSVLV